MKKYVVHDTGFWDRNPNGDPTRSPGSVQEFDTLEGMHPFDRAQFEWMEEQGEIVLSSGTNVWQIRRTT